MPTLDLHRALHNLAEAASEIAEICDHDIDEFAGVWHGVSSNTQILEKTDSPDPEDVKELLASIRWLFAYHPGSFMEAYVARADLDEQSRENERLDALKKQVGHAAAELRELMKIDPRSY